MRSLFVALSALLVVSLAPASLSAKAKTQKITITGAGLDAPLEISSYDVEFFGVWAGFGTFINGVEQTKGFIIEWLKGSVVEPPAGLQYYEVAFHGNLSREPGAQQVLYVVSYAYDPATHQGYVYLPGEGDERFRKYNGLMYHGHGFEGSWSYASADWDAFVRPLIATAQAAGEGR